MDRQEEKRQTGVTYDESAHEILHSVATEVEVGIRVSKLCE